LPPKKKEEDRATLLQIHGVPCSGAQFGCQKRFFKEGTPGHSQTHPCVQCGIEACPEQCAFENASESNAMFCYVCYPFDGGVPKGAVCVDYLALKKRIQNIRNDWTQQQVAATAPNTTTHITTAPIADGQANELRRAKALIRQCRRANPHAYPLEGQIPETVGFWIADANSWFYVCIKEDADVDAKRSNEEVVPLVNLTEACAANEDARWQMKVPHIATPLHGGFQACVQDEMTEAFYAAKEAHRELKTLKIEYKEETTKKKTTPPVGLEVVVTAVSAVAASAVTVYFLSDQTSLTYSIEEFTDAYDNGHNYDIPHGRFVTMQIVTSSSLGAKSSKKRKVTTQTFTLVDAGQ